MISGTCSWHPAWRLRSLGHDATNKLAGIPVGALWFVFGLVLTLFEAFVAFLQAYVFAILSTVYISMSYPEE